MVIIPFNSITMKSYTIILFLWTVFATSMFSLNVYSQNNKDRKKNDIREAITSRQYEFKATSAMPLSGKTIQLTSDYNIAVNRDSVIAYLPYFGRAYTAPIGKTNNGINFTSTDFLYKAKEGKKGGWTIEIKPKDQDEVQQLFLTISQSGYGTLQVNSSNRQSISFTGNIELQEKNK
jgi:hypothetical protein